MSIISKWKKSSLLFFFYTKTFGNNSHATTRAVNTKKEFSGFWRFKRKTSQTLYLQGEEEECSHQTEAHRVRLEQNAQLSGLGGPAWVEGWELPACQRWGQPPQS